MKGLMGHYDAREGVRGPNLILRAVRARGRWEIGPLKAPKAPSGCCVKRVRDGERRKSSHGVMNAPVLRVDRAGVYPETAFLVFGRPLCAPASPL